MGKNILAAVLSARSLLSSPSGFQVVCQALGICPVQAPEVSPAFIGPKGGIHWEMVAVSCKQVALSASASKAGLLQAFAEGLCGK